MSRLLVKVCGITRAEDARLAADAGADAIGFVLWPQSPRAVIASTAAQIADEIPRSVTRVGVFVNATPSEVARAVADIGLDAVQLHGDEPVEAYAEVGARIIRAVAVNTEADVDWAAGLPPHVTVLVDASDRTRRGGTGRRANWALAATLAARRPIWLAGGLTRENVGDAVRDVRPVAIDVSSGVETAPGVKDPDRLAAFFLAARALTMEEC